MFHTLVFLQCTSASQKDALLAIKATNNGAFWTANNWAPTTDLCNFTGVLCIKGFVTELDISSFNVTGQLSDQIQCLTGLKSLYMNFNNFSAPLAPAICNLTFIQHIQVQGANITGDIPLCICTLKFLKYFYINDNALTGTLPPCLANNSALIEIHSYCTGLSGGMPVGVEALLFLDEFKTQCNILQNCTSPMQNMTQGLDGGPFTFLCGVDATCTDTCPGFNLTNNTIPPPNPEEEEEEEEDVETVNPIVLSKYIAQKRAEKKSHKGHKHAK